MRLEMEIRSELDRLIRGTEMTLGEIGELKELRGTQTIDLENSK